MNFFKTCVFLLFVSHLYAEPLVIHETSLPAKSSPFMQWLEDDNATFSLDDVLKQTSWYKRGFSNIPSTSAKVVWTRFEIENPTATSRVIYLKNPRAGMDIVDAYILENGQIIKIHSLGDQRSLQKREIPHRYSIIRLNLDPHQKVEVISRLSNSIGPIESEWDVYSEYAFFQFSLMESLWWGAFLGLSLALLIYSIPILLLVKDKALMLYFSLYVFFSLSYQFFVHGVMYSFGMPSFAINLPLQFSGLFFGLFMALFIDRFLTIYRAHRTLQWVIRLVIAFQIVNAFLLLGCLFFPTLTTFASQISLFGSLLGCLVWFGLLKELLSVARDRVFYYLFMGYSVIIVAYLYNGLTITGHIPMNTLSVYSVSAASIVEMYFFMLSLAEYIRQIEQDRTRKDQLINSQMRFVSIGRVIGNISHQWKVPLVRLGALLTHIEAVLYLKRENVQTDVAEIIPQMRTNLAFMQQTIEEFYTLYHVKNHNEVFDLVQTVYNIWNMLSAKAILVNMKLECSAPKSLHIRGSEHFFSHVMMILIDNAIEIAQERRIREPMLFIEMKEEASYVELIVEDNCGGLANHIHLNSIFDMDVSMHTGTKTNEPRGMGLSIAKLLIEGKFGGKIDAQKSAKGLRFYFTVMKEKYD